MCIFFEVENALHCYQPERSELHIGLVNGQRFGFAIVVLKEESAATG